jgi:hypothetical protein
MLSSPPETSLPKLTSSLLNTRGIGKAITKMVDENRMTDAESTQSVADEPPSSRVSRTTLDEAVEQTEQPVRREPTSQISFPKEATLDDVADIQEKAKLGSGSRFAAIEKKAAASGARNPAAVAAAAGIKAHGVKKMEQWSHAAKAKHESIQPGTRVQITGNDWQINPIRGKFAIVKESDQNGCKVLVEGERTLRQLPYKYLKWEKLNGLLGSSAGVQESHEQPSRSMAPYSGASRAGGALRRMMGMPQIRR